MASGVSMGIQKLGRFLGQLETETGAEEEELEPGAEEEEDESVVAELVDALALL